jgi:hypothetical protein
MDNILKELHQGFDAKKNFNELIDTAFEKAKKIGDLNNINEIFVAMIRKNQALDMVKYMISLGADPHYKNDLPFILSCGNNDDCLILYFIKEHNVDVNTINCPSGIYCISTTTPKILRILLGNGLILTDTIIKFINHEIENVKLLLEHGISVKKFLQCCFPDERTGYCGRDIAKLLFRHIKVSGEKIINENNRSEHLLLCIIKYEELSLTELKYIFELDINPRYESDLFFTHCCKYNNTDTIAYFINEVGVDINCHNFLPLVNALKCNCLDVVRLLLEYGAKIIDKHIDLACTKTKYIKIFMDNGIDISQIAKIFIERLMGDPEMFKITKLFVNHGVDLNHLMTTN